MPKARPSTSDFGWCDPACFDWLVSLGGITNPISFMKHIPGASRALDPQVGDEIPPGHSLGFEETFRRYNCRELLLSGVAGCDFCWLMEVHMWFIVFSQYTTGGPRLFGRHTVCTTQGLCQAEGGEGAGSRGISIHGMVRTPASVAPERWLGRAAG